MDYHAATHVRERANFLTTEVSVEKHALEAKVYGSAHVTLVTVKYRVSPTTHSFFVAMVDEVLIGSFYF